MVTKITVQKIQEEEIYLTQTQVDNITLERLRQFVTPGEYIRKQNDKLYLKQDDPDHRHGSISEVIVREATPLDIAVFEVIDALTEGKTYARLGGV
jgi:hypothetical protein